ncbi:MAG: hypothetical protein Q4C04_00200 [Clostridia bacterium]|nr:hypothetical protein [Clostridia bacterium]
MRDEIGGYIELDDFKGKEYYPDLLALNSARNAVVYLIKARNIKKLCIPYFLCDCVSRVCVENNCEVIYYHVGLNFRPDSEFAPPADSWLYLVNYYGQLSDDEILEFKRKYPCMILDNVQAFFQEPIGGIDTIYTCRKYFGVPDGAYLSTNARIDDVLDMDRSADRMMHLLGRYEGVAGDFYGAYQSAEEEHYKLPLRLMSKLTHNILRAIDYEVVRHKRNENWRILSTALSSINKLALKTPEAPFMYPLYVENGAAIRKRLIQKHIYIPTLWQDVMKVDSNDLERDMAQNILPLPIDQRYGAEDMFKLINAVDEEGNR